MSPNLDKKVRYFTHGASTGCTVVYLLHSKVTRSVRKPFDQIASTEKSMCTYTFEIDICCQYM